MVLGDLPTPSAVVDLDVLERNAAAMAARAVRLGVGLRPHVKTHKCVEAARLQLAGLPPRVTVSTLAEARAFASAGFADVTYAVPLAPSRATEAVALAEGTERLQFVVDHDDAASALEDAARRRARRAAVFLKVDCGYHRAGVDPERGDSVALARRIADSPWLALRGVLTHAGHAYRCRDRDEIRRVAAQERDRTVAFAERLRESGLEIAVVSIGSTPTMSVAEDLAGVTEIRPGNYVFFDAFQAAIGSCARADVAFSVVASVIGSYPARAAAVLDAGSLALSSDPGPRHVDPECGFGVVCDLAGAEIVPGLRVSQLSQEHSKVETGEPSAHRALRVGAKVRVLPNHSCLAAACFDRYHVVRGETVVDAWRPVKYW